MHLKKKIPALRQAVSGGKKMRYAAQGLLLAIGGMAAAAACAQPESALLQKAVAGASQPSNKLRSTLPELYGWIKDLERNGIYDRSLPRPYRIALPITQWDNEGAVLKVTYAAMPGSEEKGLVFFINIPLR